MNDQQYRQQEAAKARAEKARQDAHNNEVRQREARRAAEQRKADQNFHDEQVRAIHNKGGGGGCMVYIALAGAAIILRSLGLL